MTEEQPQQTHLLSDSNTLQTSQHKPNDLATANRNPTNNNVYPLFSRLSPPYGEPIQQRPTITPSPYVSHIPASMTPDAVHNPLTKYPLNLPFNNQFNRGVSNIRGPTVPSPVNSMYSNDHPSRMSQLPIPGQNISMMPHSTYHSNPSGILPNHSWNGLGQRFSAQQFQQPPYVQSSPRLEDTANLSRDVFRSSSAGVRVRMNLPPGNIDHYHSSFHPIDSTIDRIKQTGFPYTPSTSLQQSHTSGIKQNSMDSMIPIDKTGTHLAGLLLSAPSNRISASGRQERVTESVLEALGHVIDRLFETVIVGSSEAVKLKNNITSEDISDDTMNQKEDIDKVTPKDIERYLQTHFAYKSETSSLVEVEQLSINPKQS